MKAHGYLLVFKLSILHLFICLNSMSDYFLFWYRGTRDTSYWEFATTEREEAP